MLALKPGGHYATSPDQAVGDPPSEPSPRSPAKERTSYTQNSQNSQTSLNYGKDLITYIFPDFKAVEYFRRDFVTQSEFHILEKSTASGFEIYLVDQWIRDRRIGSVASVYTGSAHSKVKVCKFTTVKKQTRDYPPRFQEYLNELLVNHATFKKMDVMAPDSDSASEAASDVPAFLLVTNISAMPHNLFLVPIPDGDARAVEHRYMVNSNLKKLNCGGRSLSLLTEKVSDASEDKFRQMYCILNEAVPVHFAILELVNIVQICLFYFDLLDAKYADGLLCHKTEDAIKNWWNLVGLPHFNSKPSHKSGILSSKTVAAILSLTVSVKLRLQLIGGCDVPKDIFDAESFMISIGHFQKQVKIEKRRKLNLLTLSRLFYYTNQNPSSEKARSFYSPFGNESSFDDSETGTLYDQSYSSPMTKNVNHSTTSLQGQAASVYRRNKIYYSKELKKLTNVVKNTVQDHIMVKEDQDDIYADPSLAKPTTKLRSKIASKLSDTLVPADIETVDIESFSKKCIVGKTLVRLWIGLSPADVRLAVEVEELPSSSSSNPSEPSKTSRHIHRRRHHDKDGWPNVLSDQSGYAFVSFRDSFSSSQDPQIADKSGRLGRMKLTFQGRKAPAKTDTEDTHVRTFEREMSKDDIYGSLLDTELQKISDGPVSPHGSLHNRHSSVSENKTGIFSTLNRRSSYPFVGATEANLSIVETLQTDLKPVQDSLRRSASFSALEEYYHGGSQISSLEKLRIQYLEQVSQVMFLESTRKKHANRLLGEVTSKVKATNLEAHKIENTHAAMLHRKSRFDTDFAAVLDIRMKDLADNLDKMAFRSRDLLKKIDELDEHLDIFRTKLETESMAKLNDMIYRVVHSAKFDSVFEDRDEKLQIVKSLTGAESLPNETATQETLCFRQIFVFFYEIMLIVLQVFNFDRSRMNLDRIRSQYKKLDPNRKYIKKVYRMIGRDVGSDAAERPSEEREE